MPQKAKSSRGRKKATPRKTAGGGQKRKPTTVVSRGSGVEQASGRILPVDEGRRVQQPAHRRRKDG